MLINECTKPEKKVSPEDYNDEYGNVRWRVGAELDHGMYIGRLIRQDPGTTRSIPYTVKWILAGICSGIWDHTATKEEKSLGKLSVLTVAKLEVDELLQEAVAAARAQGVSWSKIGDELRISKQAAQQKYGK